MNPNKLTQAQKEDIAKAVAGGCQDQYGEEILAELGIDEFYLGEICADAQVLKCGTCGWWGHFGELLDEDGNCEDCGRWWMSRPARD